MLEDIKRQIRESGFYALDLETTGLDPLTDRVLGIAIAAGPTGDNAVYVDVANGRAEFDKFRHEFQEIFDDQKLTIIGHNLKFDKSFLHSYGVWPKNPMIDTMVASHMVDENTPNGLKACVLREFNHRMTQFEEVGGLFSQDLAEYAKDDARWTFRLWKHYEAKLQEQELLAGFHSIEMPLIDVINEMERTGVQVDALRLAELGRDVEAKAMLFEKRLHERVGFVFDASSPAQLSQIFYERFRFPTEGLKPGKGGGWPTDEKAITILLKQVSPQHAEFLNYLLDYREATKLYSTYTSPLVAAIRSDTGRVHTHFHQTGTDTGRLSSSDPVNLQNIPARSDVGKEIRGAFRAAAGHKLIVADFSNIELRILAHAAMEPLWIEAFHAGRDVHQEVADAIKCSRATSKTVSFGLVYGMGVHKLSRTLNISLEHAQQLMNDYFAKLPQVQNYISAIHKITATNRWVRNLITKRRRHFEIVDERALRQSVNFIIQSTAADLMKKSMVDIQRNLRAAGNPAKILMSIHDEVVLEVPEAQAEEAASSVRSSMENAWQFDVPTPVSLSICNTWKEGK